MRSVSVRVYAHFIFGSLAVPEIETPTLPAAEVGAAKPAIGSIFAGVFVAFLGYAAAFAQAMTAAPSHAAANVALGVMVLGVALAICGLLSIWLPRLRRPTRIGGYVALALLVLAFFVDKLMIALE